jgi:hypothetical protein
LAGTDFLPGVNGLASDVLTGLADGVAGGLGGDLGEGFDMEFNPGCDGGGTLGNLGGEILFPDFGQTLQLGDPADGVRNGRGPGLAAVEIVGERAGLLLGDFNLLAKGFEFERFEGEFHREMFLMRDTIAMPLLWILFILSVSPMAGQEALSIDLSGEWRQSVDDRSTYAAADFDDRGWKTVRLPWTVRPERGVFWLRRSVRLPVDADRSRVVVCLGPVSETYEVFVNG